MKNINNVKEGEGISRVCVGWVQDSVPDYRKKKAAVEVHVRVDFLVWMASTVLLCQHPSAHLWTVAPSQLMQWLDFWTWSAMLFLGSPCLTACLCSLSLTFSVLFVSPTYVHLRAILTGKLVHTQPLSAFTLGSCSSLALGLFSESSLVWRQASLPEGHRSLSQSSRLDPWCKECIRSRVHLSVVAWRFLGEVMSWLLGSSSPGFLWTHYPETPDFLLHLCGMADVACMLYLLCLTIVCIISIN